MVSDHVVPRNLRITDSSNECWWLKASKIAKILPRILFWGVKQRLVCFISWTFDKKQQFPDCWEISRWSTWDLPVSFWQFSYIHVFSHIFEFRFSIFTIFPSWHLEAAHFGLCCRRHADWHHWHHRHLAGALEQICQLAEKNIRLDHKWSQYMDDTYIIHIYIYIMRKSSIISSHINWVHSSIHVAPIGVVNRDVAPGNTCGPACCGIPWGKLT